MEQIRFAKLFRPEKQVGWQEIVNQDPCVYCGRKGKKPTREHIIPERDGGGNSWTNIAGACSKCNQARNRVPLLMALVNPPDKLREVWRIVGSPFLK